jgi:tetratricopeptide (TPR) repeat protein
VKQLIFLSIALASVFIKPSTAQALNKREVVQLEAQAHREFQELNFHDALPLYQKLDSLRPNNPHYQFPLGVSYLYFNDAPKAIRYLEACIDKKEISTASLDYYLARAYHIDAQFDKAIQYYTQYKNFFASKKSKRHQLLFDDIDQQVAYCNNGKELYNKPLNIRIVNLGTFINSEYPEYAPIISGNGREITVTSSRPTTKGGFRDYSTDGHYYEDVYSSTFNGQKWEPLTSMGDGINTTDHDASVALSADGKSLIIYRYSNENLLGMGSGDLYLSTYQDLKWTAAEKLPFCEKKYWESSASISRDGQTMIFSSNREGSKGGSDLYSITKNANGVWSIPVSLGSAINTEFDEDSPFLTADGKTLYFSSKGHKSMGGFDVFVSHLSSETMMWSTPENIGYPLNTPLDDIHYSWSSDQKRVYFSAILPEGFGDRDIYYAEFMEEQKDSVLKHALFTASVKDALSLSIIDATFKFYELDSDGSTTSNIKQYQFTPETISKSIELEKGKQYLLVIESKGYKSHTENIDLSTAEHGDIDKLFSMIKEEE